MSEQEAILQLEDLIKDRQAFVDENNPDDEFKKDIQAIETILDLYQKKKENRRMAEHNYDELTKTTGRLKTELDEEKKKVRTTIIGRIDQVSLEDLIGDKYISKDKIKTLKENFNKKQSSFMYRSK